jgi:hypothetical protein
VIFKPGFLDRIARSKPLRLTAEPQPEVSVSEFVRVNYRRALSDRPNEYIFKNEIANQLFAARHSPDRSGLLTEFKVATARLDVVIVNGTTTCYEIKTDRDELRRLPAQLAAASLVFDKIYVVTTIRYLSAVLEIAHRQPHVGVYVLDERGKLIRPLRASSNLSNVSPSAVFDCLRRAEYMPAVARHFGSVPQIPNTRIYSACKERFAVLSAEDAHKVLAAALKSRSARKGDSVDYQTIPYELRLLYFDAAPKVRSRYASAALYQQPAWG